MTDVSWLVCSTVESLKFIHLVVEVEGFVFGAVVLANPFQKWVHSRIGRKAPRVISHLEVQQYFTDFYLGIPNAGEIIES